MVEIFDQFLAGTLPASPDLDILPKLHDLAEEMLTPHAGQPRSVNRALANAGQRLSSMLGGRRRGSSLESQPVRLAVSSGTPTSPDSLDGIPLAWEECVILRMRRKARAERPAPGRDLDEEMRRLYVPSGISTPSHAPIPADIVDAKLVVMEAVTRLCQLSSHIGAQNERLAQDAALMTEIRRLAAPKPGA